MITGIVNADFEPIISLSICGADGRVYTHEAIVDKQLQRMVMLPEIVLPLI